MWWLTVRLSLRKPADDISSQHNDQKYIDIMKYGSSVDKSKD